MEKITVGVAVVEEGGSRVVLVVVAVVLDVVMTRTIVVGRAVDVDCPGSIQFEVSTLAG